MKLAELQTIAREKVGSVKMLLSLDAVRKNGAASRNGFTPKAERPAPNRASLRAAHRSTSEFPAMGHIYAGTVPPETVAKRRVKNKNARRARAAARNRG